MTFIVGNSFFVKGKSFFVNGVEIDTSDNKTTTDGNWWSTIVVFSLNMKLDWADWPRPNLKKLGCALSESFFVNGVEIDAHENKNTIGANLSPFMADLVDSGVWASTRQKTPQLIMPV